MAKKLYFVGDGVIGMGKHCIRNGEVIPAWLSDERIRHFEKKGCISDTPMKKKASDRDARKKYNDCESDLADARQELKRLNDSVVPELREAVRVAEHNWKFVSDKYEALKKKCKVKK